MVLRFAFACAVSLGALLAFAYASLALFDLIQRAAMGAFPN